MVSESSRSLLTCVLALAISLLSAAGGSASERPSNPTDTLLVVDAPRDAAENRVDSISSPEPGGRKWPDFSVRVGTSFGLLSGGWLHPGASSLSANFGLVIPFGHRFALQADICGSSIRNDDRDAQDHSPDQYGDKPLDMWRYIISIAGYSNSDWYHKGSWTPYVSLGAGVANKSVTKFAAQFGGGSLVMIGEKIGLDVGAELMCVLNGFGDKYNDNELASIFELKAAFVLR
jgi:hypothetical protein